MNERAILEDLRAEMWKRIRAEEQEREEADLRRLEWAQRKPRGWGLVEYRRRQKAGE